MFCLLVTALAFVYAPHEEKAFVSWMRSTNNLFTGPQYHFRLGVFLANARYVECHNRKASFRVSLNKFAALTGTEYRSLLGRRPVRSARTAAPVLRSAAPESKDWREAGVVNAVKDQGQCGSCWAFGTVQACESAYALTYGKLNRCSEQNLVDCANYGLCQGCDGGVEVDALDYIEKKQKYKLMSEEDYPYTAVTGTKCLYEPSKAINEISGYEHALIGNEDEVKTLVGTKGVCVAAMDAGKWSFTAYTGGIYYEKACSTYTLDHSVGLIGYGTENGNDYWLCRNSWGKGWGEAGYFRIARNKNNHCGICTSVLLVYSSK